VARTLSLPVRLTAALACLGGAVALVGPARDEQRLHRAGIALAAGRTDRAESLAHGLTRRSVAAAAQRVVALAALQRGDIAAAGRAIDGAVASDPNDWALRLDQAVLLRRLGQTAGAQRAFERALALNPRLTVPPGFSAGPAEVQR
jgi:Flp pilus assembly protein TadD